MPATNLASIIGAPASAGGFIAAEHVLLRFNNVAYRGLVAPSAAVAVGTALDRLHQLEVWNRAHAPALCEVLHDAIARQAGDRTMRPLLHLKRDIFGGRSTKVPLDAVTAYCDHPGLREWYRAGVEIAALRRSIDDHVTTGIRDEREVLHELLRHRDLQRAAMISSLSVHAAIAAYVEVPVAAHRKGHRKSESGLLTYLLRAMTRTSPYSFYTSVGFGSFEDAGGGAAISLPASRVRRIEAHHAVVRRLIEAVVAVPEVREHVGFRACERYQETGGQIVYDVAIDDPVAHPRTFQTRQLQRRCPAARPVLVLLAWLTRHGPQSYRTIVTALTGSSGGGDPAPARALLDKLIDAGLVVAHVPIPETTDDIVADAERFLGSLPEPRSQAIARHLGDFAHALRRLPADDLEARRVAVAELHRTWACAAAVVGQVPGAAPLFYEDTALPAPVVLPAAAWDLVRRDLAELAVVVELFDNNDILQAVLRDRFVALHGAGGSCPLDDFLDEVPVVFARWLQVASMGLPAELRERLPQLALKRELRRRLRAAVRGRASDGPEIELPAGLVAEIAAELAAARPIGQAAYGLFVQPELIDGEVARVIVNHAYNGLGQFFSRFLPLLGPAATERIRDHIRRMFPADRVVASLRPVVGFNANIHPPLAAHDCALGPDDDRAGVLRPGELRLQHDLARDAMVLRVGDGGPQATVLYAGFLIPFLLPRRYSLLASLEGPGQSHIYLHDLERSPTDRVSHYPRVRYRRVVLSRRAWFAPAALVPRSQAGETDAAYFTRLNLWRRDHDIPARAFVRPSAQPGSFDDPAAFFSDLDHQREKPQFIDFESALMARFWTKWLEDRPETHVIFEEVSPLPERALTRSPDGTHVAEMLIEVDRSPWRPGQGVTP